MRGSKEIQIMITGLFIVLKELYLIASVKFQKEAGFL